MPDKSKLTLEELLKALENPEIPEESNGNIIINDDKNDVLLFITTLKISKGTERIKKRLLYKLYNNWSREPVHRSVFSKILHDYVEFNTNFYFINENDFKLTDKVKNLLIPTPHKNVLTHKNKHIHMKNFLNKYKIVKGKWKWFPCYTFYYLYDQWTFRNNKKHTLGYNNFSKFIKFYIGPYKILGKQQLRCFGIDKEAAETFTPEFIAKSIEWSNSRYGHLKKKYRDAKKEKNKKR